MGDPSRLAILERLRRGPRNVSQVVRATGLSQPSASMHLDCLWCCGLVDRESRGRFTLYSIRSRTLDRLLRSAERLLEHAADRIEQCERYR